jgi:hypothetical protein
MTPLPMYWQILIYRVRDMSLFDSRHSTRRHAIEVAMSRHIISYHLITSYHITSHYISIHADTDAAATDT